LMLQFQNMMANYRKTSDAKSAMEKFDKYQFLVDRFPILKLEKAEFLMRSSKISEGITLLKENLKFVSGDVTPIRNIIRYLESIDKQSDVEKVLEIMLEHNSRNIEAILLAASYFEGQSKFEKLQALATRAVEIDKDFYLPQVYLARSNYELGDKAKAIEKLTEIALQYKKDPTANLLLSKVLTIDGKDHNEASNFARIAHYSSFMSYETWMNLCNAYFQAGRVDLCRGEAFKMSRKFKESPGPFFWIGYAMYEEGKPEAKANLEKAIKLGLSGEKLATAKDLISKL